VGDHVEILFTAKPTTDLTKFITAHSKGVTSRKIRDEKPKGSAGARQSVLATGITSRFTTTGQVSIDVLMEYVEEQ